MLTSKLPIRGSTSPFPSAIINPSDPHCLLSTHSWYCGHVTRGTEVGSFPGIRQQMPESSVVSGTLQVNP